MNRLNYTLALKAIFAVAAIFGWAAESAAESRLSIEPVTFASHEVVNVPVNFEKGDPVVGMSCDIDLPDFLEFAGNVIKNPDRFSSNQIVEFNQRNGKLLIASFGAQNAISGDDGVLFYLPVKVKDSVTTSETGFIGVNGINFSGAGDGSVSGVAPSWTQPNFSAEVKYLPYKIAFTSAQPSVTVNPGATGELGVNIESNCDVIGFQAVMVLPAGFTVSQTACNTNRCPNNAILTADTNAQGVTRLVYFSGTNTPMTGNSGLAFTLTLQAPADFPGESVTVGIDQIQVSYAPGKWAPATGFNVTVYNDQPAYERLTAKADALQTKLDAALATIAEQYPDVKDNFKGEAIAEAIGNLRNEIEAKYAEGGLQAAEAGINTTAEGISADIDALLAAAAQAQTEWTEEQRKAGNTAAYNAVLAELSALEAELNAAKSECETSYPGIDTTADAAAAQQAIDDARAAAEAAYNAMATEGTFAYTVDKDAVKALIEKMKTDAKAAYEEAQRKAANEAAYNTVVGELDALQAALDAAKEECAASYPGIDTTADAAAAQQAIDAARAAAQAAYNAVAAEGTFTYTVDKDAVNALIDTMKADAKAAYEEAQRKAANEAAYNDVTAQIEALQQKLDAVKATVAETYPDADVEAEVTAAQQAIDAATAAAEAAYSDVADAGVFDYTLPAESIDALIDAVLAKAVADNEAARKAYNQAAYDAQIALLNQLQEELNQAIAAIAEQYPHANVIAQLNAVQTALSTARTQAEVAFVAVANEGVYTYTVDADAIRALIEAMKEAAQNQEADYQEAQRKAANDAAYQETLDQIQDLQDELDAMKSNVAENYPDSDTDLINAAIQAAQDAIDQAKAGADAAYDDVADEGDYEYTLNEDAIKALIENILNTAKDTGISSIYSDQIDAAAIYTLDGTRLQYPKIGCVNIIVSRDGKINKVLVK